MYWILARILNARIHCSTTKTDSWSDAAERKENRTNLLYFVRFFNWKWAPQNQNGAQQKWIPCNERATDSFRLFQIVMNVLQLSKAFGIFFHKCKKKHVSIHLQIQNKLYLCCNQKHRQQQKLTFNTLMQIVFNHI